MKKSFYERDFTGAEDLMKSAGRGMHQTSIIRIAQAWIFKMVMCEVFLVLHNDSHRSTFLIKGLTVYRKNN